MSDRGEDADSGDPGNSRITAVAGYLLLVGLALIVARQTLAPISNADTFFHLRFGHEFADGHWPLRHPGSVSSLATSPWTPTQWLPQVVLARFADWWGLAGANWLTALQIVGFAGAVVVLCRRRSSLLVSATVALLTIMVAAGGLSARPQVISYLLTAVTLDAWLRTRADGRLRWWLVPLTWVWAMSHGMWPIGPVIGVVAAVGGLLDRRAAGRWAWRPFAAEAGLVLASLVVTVLTPIGTALYPALYAVGARAAYIPEWGRTDLADPHSWVLFAMLVGAPLIWLLTRHRPTWTQGLLWLVAVAWSLVSTRTVPLAAVVAAPLLAAALQLVIGHEREPVTNRERWGVVVGAALTLGGIAAALVGVKPTPAPYPAVDLALDQLPAHTVVVNDWAQGGYLMWRHPDLDVGMHGYLDTYRISEIRDAQRLLAADGDWQRILLDDHARAAVLDAASPLAAALTRDLGWRQVARDGSLVLIAAP